MSQHNTEPDAKSHAEGPVADNPGLISQAFRLWHGIPLYLRILGGVILGVIIGCLLGASAKPLEIPSKLVLQLLSALASPLILLAVVQALMHAKFPPGTGFKLAGLLLLNTIVAIFIGLMVANIVRPGDWNKVAKPRVEKKEEGKKDPLTLILDNVPKSLVGPLTDGGKVISIIMIAVAFGIALRQLKDVKVASVADLVEVAFRACIIILHWIIEIIPFAVLGMVASIVGDKGFGPLWALGAFVLAVLLALFLQAIYYLVQIRLWSWPRPLFVLSGVRDALVMAFSTASSTATMPVTYACLRDKVKLRERSSSLGALVGANFNNDGTALYEAMAALFISQMLGKGLTLGQQFMVVLTSVIASVGAAGIPEAGLVTMTLVFSAVGLDPEYIPILLAVDWFLDRCRTAINVMGDVNVSCLLDGRTPEAAPEPAIPLEQPETPALPVTPALTES